MTTSELEKWAEDKYRSIRHSGYDLLIPSYPDGLVQGFIHAVEVLESHNNPDFSDTHLIAQELINILKQYAGEQPRTEDNVRERSRNKGEHE